jgi:nitric oxide synthase oxygenase domain/subunit
MIWNQQLLSFAGYRNEDGTVLGDPQNVSLTEAIMELGWLPPNNRTQWDLLPLVTMAEGEEPVVTEIPADAFPLVHIRHPRYSGLDSLGLRWVPAPALSRLGFTIGGVQYTATPFIGW